MDIPTIKKFSDYLRNTLAAADRAPQDGVIERRELDNLLRRVPNADERDVLRAAFNEAPIRKPGERDLKDAQSSIDRYEKTLTNAAKSAGGIIDIGTPALDGLSGPPLTMWCRVRYHTPNF